MESCRLSEKSWSFDTGPHRTVLINYLFLLPQQVHRVLIPEVEIKRRVPRRSLVFFVDPDPDALISCIMDGSNKYPPIKAEDWIKKKLLATYKY